LDSTGAAVPPGYLFSSLFVIFPSVCITGRAESHNESILSRD
jgi:hypothetical protein